MHAYAAHGLRLLSEIELTGFVSGEPDRPDLVIVEGPPAPIARTVPEGKLILESEPGGGRWVAIAEDDEGWLIRNPGFAEFRLSADRTTLVGTLDPSLQREWLGVVCIGSPLAMLVALEGDVALHASAAHVRDRTFAFVGPSGFGKSTVACSFVKAFDGEIVSDDLLRISPSPRRCYVGAVELRLRPGPTSDFLADGMQHRSTVDDRVAIRPRSVLAGSVGLDAIILPRPTRDSTVPIVDRVDPADALLHLLGQTRLTGWLDPVWQRRQFEGVADLVDEVPVLIAHIPWGEVGPAALEALDAAISLELGHDVSCP